MRITKKVTNRLIGGIFAAAVIAGAATTGYAQNRNAEYREWQKAQRQVQREQWEYNRTRSERDYREWQEAQRRANEEYLEYQRSVNDPYYRNDDRVRGRGYYNNGQGYYNNGQRYNNQNQVYRVYRNGSYYTTDSHGAELLRSAVNNGYSQGYRQGQIDRQYSRQYNYGGNNTYRSGTYGHQSDVAENQYQYYFQQGFQRGYEDGFNRTTQYGYRSGNNFNILGSILNTILSFTNN